jgi:TIR domain
MAGSDELERLAEIVVGSNVWPFVALDWYVHRAAERGVYDRQHHLEDCVAQLANGHAPWPWSLEVTVAVAAELMGGDAGSIEAACRALLARREVTLPREVTESTIEQLTAAGLTQAAIKRLGLTVSRTTSAPQPNGGAGMPEATPNVFISYSKEGEPDASPWNLTVRRFADLLNRNGIEAEIDQYGNRLSRDWSLWGPQAVEKAGVIICLASPGYAKKWTKPTGSGVSEEARTIRAAIAKGKDVLFVVLPGQSATHIPTEVETFHRESVATLDLAGIEDVLRLLANKPRRLKPPRGQMPPLPPE